MRLILALLGTKDGIMRIGYISKSEPSSSGVAHYSAAFEVALQHQGPVERIGRLHEPRESQRIRKIVSICFRAQFAARRTDVLFVELSGRAIAEFWASVIWVL